MKALLLPWVLLCFVTPSWAQTQTSLSAPDSLRYRRNVCPFECCQYGPWTAQNDIRVYADERDTTQIVASIPSKTTFDAMTGNVFIERFGEVDMLKDLVRYGETARYLRGDTLLLLDYLGEGMYNIWKGDKVMEDGDFFFAPEDTSRIESEEIYGLLRVTPIQRWWVRVRLHDGTEGWIDMDEVVVEGADACD